MLKQISAHRFRPNTSRTALIVVYGLKRNWLLPSLFPRTLNRRRVETISSWMTKMTTCQTNRDFVRFSVQPWHVLQGQNRLLSTYSKYVIYILKKKKHKKTHQPLCTGLCPEASHVVNRLKLKVHCIVISQSKHMWAEFTSQWHCGTLSSIR